MTSQSSPCTTPLRIAVLDGGTPVTRVDGTLTRYLPVADEVLEQVRAAMLSRHPESPNDGFAQADIERYRADRRRWVELTLREMKALPSILAAADGFHEVEVQISSQDGEEVRDVRVEVEVDLPLRIREPAVHESLFFDWDSAFRDPPVLYHAAPGQEPQTARGQPNPSIHRHAPLRQLDPIAPVRMYWDLADYDGTSKTGIRATGRCQVFSGETRLPLYLWVPYEDPSPPEGRLRVRVTSGSGSDQIEVVPIKLEYAWSDSMAMQLEGLSDALDVQI